MTAAEREQFILGNLGLVGSCAARMRGRGIEYEELYQTGCAGLIKAVDGFDPSRGCR
ncbi:MAG: flagellar biosynthesis protein FliA, partial [Oscillospiraceae bacterium]|nr:flagellar biosynthesis protein FliA [Oscillospiraceae bacterium]